MSKYICTDLHGNYNIYKKIKNLLGKSDTLYFLGDSCDRGPDGALILMDIIQDSRVHYILGNHDFFILDWLRHGHNRDHASNLWVELNGGDLTFEWLKAWSDEELNYLQEYLEECPGIETLVYKDLQIHLTHAGFNPGDYDFNHLDPEDISWDRNHFNYEWTWYEEPDKNDGEWLWGDELNEDNSVIKAEYENTYIFHGHTHVHYAKYLHREDEKEIEKVEPYIYCGGHKIDLDLCTAEHGVAALYDLSNFIKTREHRWELIEG